jgi:hypothetical protein
MTRRHALTYVLTSIDSPFHLQPLPFHFMSFQSIQLHQENMRSLRVGGHATRDFLTPAACQ